jgi:hypothetical protein
MSDPAYDDLSLSVPREASPADRGLSGRPQALSDDNRRVLQEWTAAVSRTVIAYVSRRVSDSSVFYGRIIVTERKSRKPHYLIHCPGGANTWIVTSVSEKSEVGRFPTLRAALNFVRPVLPA